MLDSNAVDNRLNEIEEKIQYLLEELKRLKAIVEQMSQGSRLEEYMSKAKLKKILNLVKKENYFRNEGGSYARRCEKRK